MSIRKLGILVAALALISCAGAPFAFAQKAQTKSIEDMGAFRAQIEEISKQIDPVLAGLNDVVKAANADPVPAFKTYTKELDKMDSQVEKARKLRAEMKKRGESLFKEWEKKMGAMTNEEIKAKASANRAKLQALYDSIEPDVVAVNETGTRFLTDLKDLRAYFEVDLSSSGIASMSDTIARCTADGQTVKGLLAKVLGTLDQVKAQLAPGGTGKPK